MVEGGQIYAVVFREQFLLLAEVSFSFAFAGLTSTRRDLCNLSKLTVLSMRDGYLATETATESSRDNSCCAGSVNSGITVKECAGSAQRAQNDDAISHLNMTSLPL